MKLFRTKNNQFYLGYYPRKNGRASFGKCKFFEQFSFELGLYRSWWAGNICLEIAPRE